MSIKTKACSSLIIFFKKKSMIKKKKYNLIESNIQLT